MVTPSAAVPGSRREIARRPQLPEDVWLLPGVGLPPATWTAFRHSTARTALRVVGIALTRFHAAFFGSGRSTQPRLSFFACDPAPKRESVAQYFTAPAGLHGAGR